MLQIWQTLLFWDTTAILILRVCDSFHTARSLCAFQNSWSCKNQRTLRGDKKKSLGAEGAFDHLLDMVGQITGREVKYYAMIDFSGFRKLIDQVGGIDIDVPERLYDNEYPTRWWWYTIVDIAPGPQHFDGDKALKYARSRHTTSDFDRSRRQQLVISALQEKMLSLDILSSPRKLEGIWNVLRSSVTTNLTIGQLIFWHKSNKGYSR